MFFNSEGIREFLIRTLYVLPAIILALSVHEYSHAKVSSRLGDPLPKASGRLSLNPFRHIDPLGFLMLMIVGFGWAKPVIVDPRFYKNKKLGMSLTALAGAAANFLTAFVTTIFYVVAFHFQATFKTGTSWVPVMLEVVMTLLLFAAHINLGLGVFNLIPISPLDGSKVLAAFLPMKYYNKVLRYERFGFLILILLLFDIPARILTSFGVVAHTAQYFGLFFYLSTVRDFILRVFITNITNVFSLIF